MEIQINKTSKTNLSTTPPLKKIIARKTQARKSIQKNKKIYKNAFIIVNSKSDKNAIAKSFVTVSSTLDHDALNAWLQAEMTEAIKIETSEIQNEKKNFTAESSIKKTKNSKHHQIRPSFRAIKRKKPSKLSKKKQS